MTITEELIKHIRETKFEAIPGEAVEHAKKRIIDVIGCALAGSRSPVFPRIIELAKEWGGKEESTILAPKAGKIPTRTAAMVNSVLATCLDFEPVCPLVEGKSREAHFSGVTIPTALVVAEHKQATGKALLTALIVGDDIASRVLTASDFTHSVGFTTGWSAEGTMAGFGLVAIAGRLWGLDKSQLLNAFGIVFNQASGSVQSLHEKSHCYKLNHGFASRNGVTSVELASRGFNGLKDPLLGKYGYFAQFCRSYHPEALTRELGKKFYSDHVFKRYPAGLSNHSAIECTLELVRKHDMKPADIAEVTVRLFRGRGREEYLRPFEVGNDPHMDANWSMAYQVANVLLRKEVRLEYVMPEFVLEPAVLALARKVKILETPPRPLGIDVVVKMNDGKEFPGYLDAPPLGWRDAKPLPLETIRKKFRDNVAFAKGVSRENTEKALGLLENLEEVANITEIIKLLT